MNIVITMAGLGTRFLKAGYDRPKYEIEVMGKTLFEWAMLSLEDFNKLDDVRYIFVTLKKDSAKDFILDKMKDKKVKDIYIKQIDNVTDGQATSAILAKEYWKEDEELIIYNIDTYVEQDVIKYSSFEKDGFIPCFKADGDHWSFVKLNEHNDAVLVKEKERISDNCTIGLYYFKTCRLYEKIYNEYYKDDTNIEQKEKYIAPLYNYMIQNNMKVGISILPEEKVHVLGTPEEVETFKMANT